MMNKSNKWTKIVRTPELYKRVVGSPRPSVHIGNVWESKRWKQLRSLEREERGTSQESVCSRRREQSTLTT